MKKTHTLLLFLVFSVFTFSAHATDYYFSATGNDNNTGTGEGSPFRTLTKASSLVLVPGDRLLFKRGDTFRGELQVIFSGTTSNPITVTSYGTGADAIISGSEYINNWVSAGNGIYRASCPVYPQMVFYNGATQQLSRYPNQGFLFTDGANGNNGFSDSDLPNGGSYYVGAGVNIRTARYRYEERTVAAQDGAYLGFNTPTAETIVAGAGYYLSNKLEFIDVAGEYFYDAANQQLYFKTPNGQPPADNTVEASRYEAGIRAVSSANLFIRNLKIQHQQQAGLFIYGVPTDGLDINNCVFQHIYNIAITGAHKNNVNISNNQFYDIWNTAVYLGGITNLTIANNIFKRIGIAAPGRATDNLISYKCINMNFSSGTIKDNILDSIGNNGIEYYQNTVVERNLISKFCLTTDDGAGIVSFGTWNGVRNGTNCIVRYNIVSDAVGNAESYPLRPEPFVNGIGMDDNSGNAVIENNTIYNIAGRGISIHNSSYNQIRNNTVFNCNNGSLVFEHDNLGGMLTDNVSSGNILYNIHPNEYALKLLNWNQAEPGLNFGSFSNNYYINPYFDAPIYTIDYVWNSAGYYSLVSNEYSVKGWRAAKDAGAKASPVKLDDYVVTSTIGNNLVTNGNFDTNLDGWACWAQNNSCNTSWQNNGALDGGYLKITAPLNSLGEVTNTQLFSMQQGKQYLFSYSIVGDENKITAFNIQDRSNWAQLTQRIKKEVATTRINHKQLISPAANTTSAQLTFFIAPEFVNSFSLDNIKMQEVTTTAVDPLTQNIFYVNKTNSVQNIPLSGVYLDVDGSPVYGSITLQPFTSKIVIATNESGVPTDVATITDPDKSVLMYPNPLTNNKLNILINGNYTTARIFSLEGRILLQSAVKKGANVLTLPPNISRGTYMVQLTGKGITKTFKLLKN